MSYLERDREDWETAVLVAVREDGGVAEAVANAFLAGQARIAAGDGCPDCGCTAGHSLPCRHYEAAKALQRAGVAVPGYPRD